MKIGIVTTWQERGAAYVSSQFLESLKRDNEVLIYARGGEKYAIGDPKWDKPYVTWGKKIPIHMPLSIDLADFKKWLIRNKIELVIFNEQQWWDPIILARDLQIKIGAYIDYYTEKTVPFFGLYDFLICNTLRHHSVFASHPQAFYVPWGTETSIYQPKSLQAVDNQKVIFFHSSGMSPERKGTDILLRAFAKLTGPRKLIIHTQTDIVQAYPDLAVTVKNLAEADLLDIINKEVSAPGLYHLGDVYVYPSRLDGIGLTICEALSCGLPVITSDNPPMNEFVDSDNGRLVAIAKLYKRGDNYFWPQCDVDEDSLTAAMQYYIDNFKFLPEFKMKARSSAETRFDWSKNSQNLSQLLKGVVRIPDSPELILQVKEYEARRSGFLAKAYRRSPWLFKPFSWFWWIIKKFYI